MKLFNRSMIYKSVFTIFILNIFTLTLGCGNSSNSISSTQYSGNIALSWNAPTQNEDGSPLTDLSGYKIYFGPSSNNYTQHVDVGNVTSVNLSNLAPGKYYFTLVAYDHSGNESDYSQEIWKYVEDL